MKTKETNEDLNRFQGVFQSWQRRMEKRIIGQSEVIKHVLYGVVSGGHILIEGAPGLGKTELIKELSQTFALSFSRIQFTPDLMPSDILGATLIENAAGLSLRFQKGPIFSHLILADEINRGTPKTQSALLQAMQEKMVTVDNKTYPLPDPFFVMATKNPLDMEGTYPLPEAQLDRFMFSLKIGLPQKEALMDIVRLTTEPLEEGDLSESAVQLASLTQMREWAEQVLVPEQVMSAAVDLMMATHPGEKASEDINRYVKYGVSPRGVQSLVRAGRVKALSEGRFHVSQEDIESLCLPCFRHRLFLNYQAYGDGVDAEDVVRNLIEGLGNA